MIERDGCLAAELAQHFALDKSTVSRQVSTLEQANYLRREVDPTNRRNHVLHATAAGRAIAREADERRREAFTLRFLDWDDADVARFADYLRRYNDSD
ncbi:MarR family winged helix-turn-helix transcriptional regulator [Nocardia otitidiscaviarum]|uniref:MarR family winged helix-turn-helix transcriptional regulator n=1 Tax=Nocardia otitidiscaviarum TaxID=1823 RepID=UPI002B4B469B|nr:MarR family transcriptional regulator [Nocardia otitidiscaviarum]